MQLYKYTSLKEVILKIYRDSGADRDLNIDDLAYWAYEALEGIASNIKEYKRMLTALKTDLLTGCTSELPKYFPLVLGKSKSFI